MAHVFKVGQPYHPSRLEWPECVQYNYRGGQHELLLFFASPTAKEVRGVRQGRADFAVLWEPPVVVFLYRLEGACGWSHQPFSWHLVPEGERQLPPGEGGGLALLNVVLIDAATGLVRALRAVTMSEKTTARLHSAIREQAAAEWKPAAYAAAVDRLNEEPSAALVKRARG